MFLIMLKAAMMSLSKALLPMKTLRPNTLAHGAIPTVLPAAVPAAHSKKIAKISKKMEKISKKKMKNMKSSE
jgi:hypothetical protein